MPLFVCDRCGCVENTALGRYWSKDEDYWADDNRGQALCSECAPTTYKDGRPVSNMCGLRQFGKWHGQFPKQKWDGKMEVINRGTKGALSKEGIWEKVNEDLITPGGEPLYECSVCHSRESRHLFGVENPHKILECPACHAKMKYPWE